MRTRIASETDGIGEAMIDAKQAAASLRLPYYWFADPMMRAKHRIPHYLLGGLVRYRLSELQSWASQHASAMGRSTSDGSEEVGV